MSKLEYDSFFYDGRVVYLACALDEEQKNLLDIYDRDKLFCPECHVAKLTFTHATSNHQAYLSTNRGSFDNANRHLARCSHAYPKAKKYQVKSYYEQLNEGQISDKLQAAINHLLRNHSKFITKTSELQIKCNPVIAIFKENGQHFYRQLPTRSIYSIYEVTDDELDLPILLYGEVMLSIEEKKSKFKGGKPYYHLWIRDKKSNRKIRYFYRGSIKDDIIENTVYYVSMIVVFKKHKPFPWSELYNPNAILYIRK